MLVEELASSYSFSDASKSLGWSGRLAENGRSDSRIGLLFGTHNNLSCAHILECMVDSGLAYKNPEGRIVVKDGVEERICFGQLFGMSLPWGTKCGSYMYIGHPGMRDDLTNWVVETVQAKSPMVLK
jgi:hypothetical protein